MVWRSKRGLLLAAVTLGCGPNHVGVEGEGSGSGGTTSATAASATAASATATSAITTGGSGTDDGCRDGVAVAAEFCFDVLHVPEIVAPSLAATADFDGNGLADVAIVYGEGWPDRELRVVSTEGTSYRLSTSWPVSGDVLVALAGDFNGDGAADVALSYTDVTFRYNEGGALAASEFVDLDGAASGGGTTLVLPAAQIPWLVKGHIEGVATWWRTDDGAWLVYGSPDALPVCPWLGDAVSADFDGNEIADVVAFGSARACDDLPPDFDEDYESLVLLLFNPSLGGLQPSQTLSAGVIPEDLAVGDVDGDGLTDVVVGGIVATPDGFRSALSVLQGVGPGQFADAVVVAVGLSSSTIAAADLDGDGDHEIVVSASDGLSLIDDPLGTAVPTTFGIGYGVVLAIDDLNGDEVDDVVAFHSIPASPNQLVLVLSNP